MKVYGFKARPAAGGTALAVRDLSVDDIRQGIYAALDDLNESAMSAMAPTPDLDDYCYVEEQYADYCIVSCGAQYWRVPFTVDDAGAVTLDPPASWTAVEQQWMTKHLGARPVRLLGETETSAKLGGWLVVFGGKDLVGDTFEKSTDFWLDRLGAVKPLLYDHGQDTAIKSAVLGSGTITPFDDGLWFAMQLDKSKAYASYVLDLVNAGALGLSSGAVGHLIEMSGSLIKSWPIAEGSLTTQPCEPRTLGVEHLRTLVAHVEALKDLLPKEPSGSEQIAARGQAAPTVPAIPRKDDDVDLQELMTKYDEQAKSISALTTLVEGAMKRMEDAPAIRQAGYFTVDGGTADPKIKNFGDFLMAIKRNDATRLTKHYGSTRSLNESDGGSGGWITPIDQRADLLSVANQASAFLGLIKTIPVSTDSGLWPALDQYVAPTAGNGDTAFAAGVVATPKAEGAELPETEPTFAEIEFKIRKVGGVTYVTNELNADSATSIETLLRMLFGVAISAKREYFVLRGNGVQNALGILNAPALINVTPGVNDLFSYTDALAMLSHLKIINAANVRFLMHQSRLPDLGTSSWTQGNTLIRLSDLGYGAPAITEHLPQKTHTGSVLLADFSAYLLFVRQELAISFSEHAAFTSDRGVWRFTERYDGQPWMKGPITLADPTGSFTVSPFVNHND